MTTRSIKFCQALCALSFGLMVASACHAADQDLDEVTVSEPMVNVEIPVDDLTTPDETPVAALGSDATCDITVVAKSPDAVADPCLTTDAFIDTLAVLTSYDRQRAFAMVASSQRQISQLHQTRLAH